MNPVAIFRHLAIEGPGYLADFLDEQNIPWQLIRIDAGELVPDNAAAYSGLVFMGGPMSVNDDLPWIPPALALIRDARDKDIPLLGHCLGGQLMAKALGGAVTPNPVKEIGWGKVTAADTDTARQWLGDANGFDAFHWHGETFSLPPGAVPLLSSAHCANQAYVLDGRHLGMQCHVEMTADMIRAWCQAGADEIAAASGPAVQTAADMQSQMAEKLPPLHAVARRLYLRWSAGLAA